MFSIHDEEKIKELLVENGHKPFRYGQIENAIYKNFISEFDEIGTISKDLRQLLNDNCYFQTLKIEEQLESKDWQTTKMLWETSKWHNIESVIMRHQSGRNTLCISCQSGCPMACTFCATGKLWLLENLHFSEIIEQVMYAAHILNNEWSSLRNVVFMGMGEPFLNYPNVKKAIEIMTEQKKINLSNRRVTVSTCGIVPWIEKFTADFDQTSLAISLHAPTDEVRREIMPVDHTYPLDSLMTALDKYTHKTRKRIFYEYIMINGVTDNIHLAYKLWELLKGRMAHVNFIPYNPGEWAWWVEYATTPKFLIQKFQKVLDEYWVPSTIRVTMWDDIAAACGQLANKNKEKLEEKK